MKKLWLFSFFLVSGLYISTKNISATEEFVQINNETEETQEIENSSESLSLMKEETDVDRIIINQLQNPDTKDYVYTSDFSQRESLKEEGYEYQGTSWIAPSSSEYPVYEMVNSKNEKYYTMNEEEYNYKLQSGWIGNGIAWYSSENEETPVFYVYNENTNQYYYTTNFDTYISMKDDGWIRKGIAWYGWDIENKERFENYKQENKNTVQDGNYIISIADGNGSLNVNSNNQVITGNSDTLWKFENLESGYVIITNTNSGKSLTVSNSSKYEGVTLVEALFENTNNQLWIVESTEQGYVITSALQERYVMSKYNDLVTMFTKEEVVSQYWVLERVLTEREKIDEVAKSNQTLQSAVYKIYMTANTDFILSGVSGNTSNNANVLVNKVDGSRRQTWIVENVDNGYYSITNLNSGRALTVNGVADKSNLYQYDYAGGYDQKWLFVQNENGSYTIYSALDLGYVVDLNSLSIKDNDNGILYHYDQSIYQYFTMSYVRDIQVDSIEYSYSSIILDSQSTAAGAFNAAIKNLVTNADLLTVSFVVNSTSHSYEFESTDDGNGNYSSSLTAKYLSYEIGDYVVNAKLTFAGSIVYLIEMGTCYVVDVYENLQQQIVNYINSKTKGNWQVYFQMVDDDRYIDIDNTGRQYSASVIKLYVMGTVYDNYESICAYKSKSTVDYNLKQMITVSDNTSWKNLVTWLGNGSYAQGCAIVSAWAASNGYEDTLTEAKDYHNWTSAKDSAQFFMDVYNGKYEHSADMLDLLKKQQRTTKIPAGVPSTVETGNKTGELSDSVAHVENDAAIIYAPAGTYVLSVLSSGITNSTARTVIKGISSLIYNFFN